MDESWYHSASYLLLVTADTRPQCQEDTKVVTEDKLSSIKESATRQQHLAISK